MRYLFLVCTILAISPSCNCILTKLHQSDECQAYYQLVKDSWMAAEGYYRIKGNPLFEKQNPDIARLFSEKCMIDLPLKKAQKIFGRENKVEKGFYGGNIYTYCLTPKCDRTMILYTDSLNLIREMRTRRVIYEQD